MTTAESGRLPLPRKDGEELKDYMARMEDHEYQKKKAEYAKWKKPGKKQAGTSEPKQLNAAKRSDSAHEGPKPGEILSEDAADSGISLPVRPTKPTVSEAPALQDGVTENELLRRFGARKGSLIKKSTNLPENTMPDKPDKERPANEFIGFGNEASSKSQQTGEQTSAAGRGTADTILRSTNTDCTRSGKTGTTQSKTAEQSKTSATKQTKSKNSTPASATNIAQELGNSVFTKRASAVQTAETSSSAKPTAAPPSTKRPAPAEPVEKPSMGMSQLPKIQKRTSVASPQSPERVDGSNDEMDVEFMPGSDGKTPLWVEKHKASGRRGTDDGNADVLLKRLRTATSADVATVANILHALAFTPMNENLLYSNRILHRNGVLRKIFDADVAGSSRWPHYIQADAEELFNRWSRKVFVTDLLFGIRAGKAGKKTGKAAKEATKEDETTPRYSDSLDPAFTGKVPYNRFGMNGLLNGQWWPTQLCTVRDGAHGASQGGISGKSGDGAYCCIMTGAEQYPDEDHGDSVLYCGTDSKDGNLTTATQLMLDSLDSGNPVRLIRSSALGKYKKSEWAPKCGYRFGGLYKVTAVETLKVIDNSKAARRRFKMERLPGQDPIRGGDGLASRPTQQEIDEFNKDKRFRGF